MNVTRIIISALTFATLTTFSGNIAWADKPSAQLNSANRALVEGKIDEALAQYRTAEQLMSGSPLLAYNKGVALYRQGQLDQARQSFTGALDTDNPELATKASFNLGNCHYANAVQQPESERGAAIESLQTAITHYRSALQANSTDTDARANIELAQKLMQKLHNEEEQQQNQQQQQDQQQQDQQQSDDQDSQNQDSNQSPQNQSEQSDSQGGKSDDKESDDQETEGSESDENQSDQQTSNQDPSQQNDPNESESDESKSDEFESDESASDEQNDQEKQSQDQNSAGSNSDESDREPSEQQDSSGTENEDQQPESEPQADGQQPESQPGEEQQEMQGEEKPDQELQAGNVGQQDQQGDGKQMPGYAVSQPGELGEKINKEEAMKMLQAIRDRDLKRRIQKLNETRRRHRPVDRDW